MNNYSRFKTTISWLVSLTILAAGGVAFAFLVHRPVREPSNQARSKLPLVQTVPLVEHAGFLDMDVDGVVVPFREISVAAEIPGRVRTKTDLCRAGSVVAQGTLLLEIDPRDYELEVQRAEAQLAQSRASLAEWSVESANTESVIRLAEEDAELNRVEVQRMLKLFRDRGAIAESELDKAKRADVASRNLLQTLINQRELLKSRKDRLESSRNLAETELAKAKLNLARTRIVAPVDGVVVRESVEQDSFVQAGAALVAVEDTSAVEVRCSLKMEQVAWLWRQDAARAATQVSEAGYQVPRTPVTITYEIGDQEFAWEGMLARYEGIGLDERTRTVPCRVVVQDPRGKPSGRATVDSSAAIPPPPLVRGMYVTVHLHLTPNVPLAEVPEAAVRPGKVLWVVRDGRLRTIRNLHLVELVDLPDSAGRPAPHWLLDLGGADLRIGDAVVVSPLAFVLDGQEVRIQNP